MEKKKRFINRNTVVEDNTVSQDEETPKVEDSAPSSLPQYTQSLGAIEKGYSLDDVFARLKGGK